MRFFFVGFGDFLFGLRGDQVGVGFFDVGGRLFQFGCRRFDFGGDLTPRGVGRFELLLGLVRELGRDGLLVREFFDSFKIELPQHEHRVHSFDRGFRFREQCRGRLFRRSCDFHGRLGLDDLRCGFGDERLLLFQFGFEFRHLQLGEDLSGLFRLIGAGSCRSRDFVADIDMHLLHEAGELRVDRCFLKRFDPPRLFGDADERLASRLDRRDSYYVMSR